MCIMSYFVSQREKLKRVRGFRQVFLRSSLCVHICCAHVERDEEKRDKRDKRGKREKSSCICRHMYIRMLP